MIAIRNQLLYGLHSLHVLDLGKDLDLSGPGLLKSLPQSQKIFFIPHKGQHHSGDPIGNGCPYIFPVAFRQRGHGDSFPLNGQALPGLYEPAPDHPGHDPASAGGRCGSGFCSCLQPRFSGLVSCLQPRLCGLVSGLRPRFSGQPGRLLGSGPAESRL